MAADKLFLLALLPALLGGCRWLERSMLYVPSRELTAHPGSYGLPFEELDVTAPDGPRLHGWLIAREPKDPVVILCHGNGGNISHRLQKAMMLRRAGASVVLFDYRGYGRSAGTPTEKGTYLDAQAVYDWTAKRLPGAKIVLHGESLGCGPALETALRRPAAGLILDSGFTSTVEMGKLVLPWLPVSWMVSFKYDNLKKIPGVACPLLVMHSPQDDIIPFTMGVRLHDAARSPKTFFEMKGDHNEGFLLTGKAYEEAVRRFLALVTKPA